jgi:hypothetical protein
VNIKIGDKLGWMEKGEPVRAYVTGFHNDLVILKVHGKPGKFQIPRKSLVDQIMQEGKQNAQTVVSGTNAPDQSGQVGDPPLVQ